MRTPLRDRDAVILGVVAVIFLHVLFFATVPRESPRVAHVEIPKPQPLAFRLLTPEAVDEAHYLRANPSVESDQIPETLDYSDRNQVAAQEIVTPLSNDGMPAMQGDELQSNRIVQGDPFRQPPQPQAANPNAQPQATSPAVEQRPAPNQAAVVTAPEAVETESLDPEGLLALENPAKNPEEVEDPDQSGELQLVLERSPMDGTGRAQNFSPPPPLAQAPAQPMPRPRVPPDNLDNSHGPLRDSRVGVARQGRIAISSRYSEFGVYWKRVTEIIEKRWNNLVYNSLGAISFDGERVQFEVLIHRDGSVSDLRVLHSGVSRFEETLARDAILSRAPFFEWTPEMIATMGEETTFVIGFIY